MTVFLTGATGFVGSYVLRALREHGHRARCLVRDPSDALSVEGDEIDKVTGDVTDPSSLRGVMDGCDAAIHLVGIIEEKPSKGITFEQVHYAGTVHVVDEARRAGAGGFLQMSANGARPDGVSEYQTTKWRAEQYVRQAGFGRWGVFRPSTLFGAPGPGQPEFATQLARMLVRPFPILPVFGDGSYRMAPVAVEEVAEAFVRALDSAATHEKTYCAAGPEALPYVEVLDRIARGCGLAPRPKVPIPIVLARPVVKLFAPLGLLPLSADQFEMLIEGNTCDASAFRRDFDLAPTPFTPDHLTYLHSPA